jgi:hypothetical protein
LKLWPGGFVGMLSEQSLLTLDGLMSGFRNGRVDRIHAITAHVVSVMIVMALLFTSTSQVRAQLGEPIEETEERGLRQLIGETQQSIASEKWLEAIEQFDTAWKSTCESGDPLMTLSGADVRQLLPGQTEGYAGGKALLERVYQDAPPAFRDEYRRQWEDVAETKIRKAIEAGDLHELRSLCLRYSFLPASRNGYEILTRVSIDRADFQEAALLLGRLERMSQLENEGPNADRLIMLATCFARAGLLLDARDTLLMLRQLPIVEGRAGLPNLEDPADVMAWLNKVAGPATEDSSFAWLQPGGDYRRSSLQNRSPALLKPSWSSTVYSMNDVLYSDQYNETLTRIRRDVERQFVRALPENKTVIPSTHTLVHRDLAIIRTPFGVRAVRRGSGELVWEVCRPDSEMRALLDRQSATPEVDVDFGMGGYMQFMPPWQVILPHTIRVNTASQMSISGRTLFVVDECTAAAWNENVNLGFANAQQLSIPVNFIRAYDVETGLFLWEIGGKSQTTAQPVGKGNLLSGFYFLGAPLVLGERTYVLAESGEGIFLIQIVEPNLSTPSANPSIARSQILTIPRTKLPEHPVRKFAGMMPSFAQGLLICPTCDERIVAVAAEDHSLRWVFRYGANIRPQEIGGDADLLFGARDTIDSARIDLDSRWIDSLPRVVHGRVLVTPRDSDQLYCLNLQTGHELWRIARSGFHGIAATTDDAVILVGNQRVSSFKLEDGTANWTTPITDGIVCGTASCNGQLLQVPVSDPAILSFEVGTGSLLVRQPLPAGTIPGNLLTTPDGMLMQSVSEASWFPRTTIESPSGNGANNDSNNRLIVNQTVEFLLDGRLSEAIALLEQQPESAASNPELRSLMIEVMLRAMRSDFRTYRSLLPKVRQLYESSRNNVDVTAALHSMLGMNIADVPTVAKLFQGDGRRFVDVLLELEAQEISQGSALPVDEVVKSLSEVIRQLPEARSEQTVTGLLHRTRASVLLASIRNGLKTRSIEDRRQIATGLQKVAEETILTLTIEQAQVQFVTDLIDSGLYETALPLLADGGVDKLRPRATLLLERLRLAMAASGVDSVNAAESLLTSWVSQNRSDISRSFLRDISEPVVPGSAERFQLPDDAARSAIQSRWQIGGDKLPALKSAWMNTPGVEESDDRTMLPTEKKASTIPDQDIPLFGPPGVFRDWSFTRNASPQGLGGDFVMAFDGDGVLRWQFKSISTPGAGDGSYVAQSWMVASGHLLIFCENGMLTAMDASEATPSQPPRRLWNDFLARLVPDDVLTQYQSYVPSSERVVQYFPQPSGLFPSGLIRLGTIPVMTGRRLTMLSAYTGHELWHLDGLAPDSVLLGHDDTVLIMSEQARQIEIRHVLDGSPVTVSRLPEWWGEAIANVGSSVRTIELEAGSNTIWRVGLFGRSCVLFRLTDGASTLECRDLVTDQVQWEMALAEDTVFSNCVDDVVAVLVEGKRLLLIQMDSGRTLADLEVSVAENAYDLILRKSHGEYIVLPAADPEPNDFPITNAIYVKGRMYAVNAETFKLSWDKPLADRHIRTVVQAHGATLPNAPALVLLGRGAKGSTTGGIRKVRYGVQIVDVHTGEDLYADDDVGVTLNDHWLQIDSTVRKLVVSFERRFITLDYTGEK